MESGASLFVWSNDCAASVVACVTCELWTHEYVGGPLDGETRAHSDAAIEIEWAVMVVPNGGPNDGVLRLGTCRYRLRHALAPLAVYDFVEKGYPLRWPIQ